MNTSLNLSGKIDSATVSLFEIVTRELGDLEIPYVVVGATARDLVMHYGYGANIKRASHDVDFGINIESWEMFHTLRDRLCDEGFTAVNDKLHKLIGPEGMEIEIVPFGCTSIGTTGGANCIRCYDCSSRQVCEWSCKWTNSGVTG